MTKNEIRTIIIASALIVLGILFCFSLALGLEVIGYVIGISLIVGGVFCVVSSFVSKKNLITTEGVIGAALASFGVFFMVNHLYAIIFNYIPYLLMGVGVIVIIDAIYREVANKETTKFVIELIIGVIALALGICLEFINGFKDFCSVMLGIVMIVYAIYILSLLIIKKSKEKNS